jgi:dihydroorotase
MIDRLRLTTPDDWHLHVRDGAMLGCVLPDTVRQFARAIIMPNLVPPVATVADALAYRQRILAALPASVPFEPLMTLYLTEQTTVEDIAEAAQCPHVHAVKYYPAGATTNAASGVRDLARVQAVLAAMEKHDVPLLMHGEVTDRDVDVFDREAVFIERHLLTLMKDFPGLRLVMEHITTSAAAELLQDGPENLAATVTVHHLLLNRNALFDGGLRPHHYCLPLIKRERHRQALLAAVASGHPRLFLGTDSAPHPQGAKESACGCAGIYTAAHAMALYAEVFDGLGALDRLEAFASFNGPDFYRLPRNHGFIELERDIVKVAEQVDFGGQPGIPFRAGGEVHWRLVAARAA